MTQNLLRQSGHGPTQAEMLRVADLVTNPSQEYVQHQRMISGDPGAQQTQQDINNAVTSADIR